MVVLDTDHASELGFRSAVGLRLLERLTATGEDAVITAITAEEQLRGWLAQIHRASHPTKQIAVYDCLARQIEFLASWVILAWDVAAVEAFQRLRRGRRPDRHAGFEDCFDNVDARRNIAHPQHSRLRSSARFECRELVRLSICV
jgi:hypothetical protein